jgi:undecaprenyl diphosphate synthase
MTQTDTSLKHLGIILDGNRRWARANGLPTLDGHQKGAEVFKEISLSAFKKGINYVSAYVFSTENWNRTQEEVSYLMKLVLKAVEKYLDEFHQNGIKIKIIGSRKGLDAKVAAAIDKAETKTADNTKGTLGLCFNYGGQQEVVDAIKALPDDKKDNLTPDTFEQYLYSKDFPNIDLLIRTSGEKRLSGFMMWKAQYAEFMFFDKHWPDFSESDLDLAIEEFGSRVRRFGGNEK